MNTTTAIVVSVGLIAAVLAYRAYAEAKAREAQANQWNSLIKAGTTLLGFL